MINCSMCHQELNPNHYWIVTTTGELLCNKCKEKRKFKR